jgi:hypothetical protein
MTLSFLNQSENTVKRNVRNLNRNNSSFDYENHTKENNDAFSSLSVHPFSLSNLALAVPDWLAAS